MCLKDLFKKPEIILPEITDNTIYHFAAGNYPGTNNDLPGPPYDQKYMTADIAALWPNYTFRKYLDGYAKRESFLNDLTLAVNRIKPGDTLVFISDYCYPGTSTDNIVGVRSRNPGIKVLAERFIKTADIPDVLVRSRALRDIGAGNYIAMSACPDWQTALDVEINGKPTGLYHFVLRKTMKRGITWNQWTQEAGRYVKELGFDRIPIIEGPDSLIHKPIFEGNNQVFILSMHGTTKYDKSGDEKDSNDEGPYFPNGFVSDDQINKIISTNAWLC